MGQYIDTNASLLRVTCNYFIFYGFDDRYDYEYFSIRSYIRVEVSLCSTKVGWRRLFLGEYYKLFGFEYLVTSSSSA